MRIDAEVDLPPPDPDAAAHCAAVTGVLRERIREAGGALGFERFMDGALYAPGLGYYMAGARKFGRGGDFVTAPELSPLFARCLARQVAEGLSQAGGEILELGAGTGIMAADLLSELAALDCLPAGYSILEPSPELRARQRETLAERVSALLPRVRWLSALPREPMAGVIVANEVLDAMPVRRFRITETAPRPLNVCWRDHAFAWTPGPADAELTEAVADIQARLPHTLDDGYVSEFNPTLGPWVRAVGEVLRRGLILLIDYGYPRVEYYHPLRRSGTLMCHYRHRAHTDPLVRPGIQDITASVDFTAVADAALDASMELLGYTTQAWFLLNTGLDQVLSGSRSDDPVRDAGYARQAQILALPGEMGERFKVMALARGLHGPLCGFATQDQRHRL